MVVIYTGTKLESHLTSKILLQKGTIMNYHAVCPEDNCNEDDIGECAKRLEERTQDHNGRDKNSHMLRHSIKSGHDKVLESDFQINGKGYRYHTGRRKNSEALFMKNKKSY